LPLNQTLEKQLVLLVVLATEVGMLEDIQGTAHLMEVVFVELLLFVSSCDRFLDANIKIEAFKHQRGLGRAL